MAASYVFDHCFACCLNRRKQERKNDLSSTPNEHTLLLPSTIDSEPSLHPLPNIPTTDDDNKRTKDRMSSIIREKESKMVNVNARFPFNLQNKSLSVRIHSHSHPSSSSRSASTSSRSGGGGGGAKHNNHAHAYVGAPIPPSSSSRGDSEGSSYLSPSHSTGDTEEGNDMDVYIRSPILGARIVHPSSVGILAGGGGGGWGMGVAVAAKKRGRSRFKKPTAVTTLAPSSEAPSQAEDILSPGVASSSSVGKKSMAVPGPGRGNRGTQLGAATPTSRWRPGALDITSLRPGDEDDDDETPRAGPPPSTSVLESPTIDSRTSMAASSRIDSERDRGDDTPRPNPNGNASSFVPSRLPSLLELTTNKPNPALSQQQQQPSVSISPAASSTSSSSLDSCSDSEMSSSSHISGRRGEFRIRDVGPITMSWGD